MKYNGIIADIFSRVARQATDFGEDPIEEV